MKLAYLDYVILLLLNLKLNIATLVLMLHPLYDFKRSSYALLNERIAVMPPRMQHVVTSMTTNDWFKEYETIEGVGLALDNIAKRIRFTNNFTGAAEDIAQNCHELESVFLAFFPELIEHVNEHALERAY